MFLKVVMFFSCKQEAGEGLVELRRIETAETITENLTKSRNVTFIPETQPMLLNVAAH